MASAFYFFNIVANISKDAKVLKYITPFGYTEGSVLIYDNVIPVEYFIPGMMLMVAGIC